MEIRRHCGVTNPFQYKPAYRRFLPHIQPPGATLFVTFRLAGSLPIEVLNRWREEAKVREKQIAALPMDERAGRRYLEEKRFFGRFDAELDRASYGPTWLREPAVAQVVYEAIRRGDGVLYDLDVFTIMPNHVHAVFTPLPEGEGYHALSRIMYDQYVLNNPVKAGLVDSWEKWPWTYWKHAES
jgi:hypothetical protein